LFPEPVELLDLAAAAVFSQVFGDGADDPAAGVLGHQLRDHLAQLGALLAVLDLAGHADLGGERHVDEKPTRERDLGRNPRPLGADRLLDDLDDLGLALLQLVGDVGQPAAAPPPSGPPPPPPRPAPRPPRAVPLPRPARPLLRP